MSGDAKHVEVKGAKRTAFRPKGPATNDCPPAGATSARGSGGLDWQAFTAAYFPGRRRHDLEAVTGYAAYKRSRDAGAEPCAEPAGTETGRGATAVRNWEDEGGATLTPDAP